MNKFFCAVLLTALFSCTSSNHAEGKPSAKADEQIPYMIPGMVMANRVWIPDADGYFRLPGKFVGGGYGFIDKSGKLIVPGQFEQVSYFTDGMCAVKLKGKWGYIDKSGKLVVPAKFNDASNFGEGLAAVRERRGWYFIDKTGAIKIPETKYSRIDTFHDGLCAVNYDDKWGFVDHNGKETIPCKYYLEGAPQFRDGISSVRPSRGSAANLIDKSGHVLPASALNKVQAELNKELADMQIQQNLQKKYETVYPFTEDLAMVKQKGKCGFIDRNGNEVIKPSYTDANSFFEGLAGVYAGGHFEKGQIIGRVNKSLQPK